MSLVRHTFRLCSLHHQSLMQQTNPPQNTSLQRYWRIGKIALGLTALSLSACQQVLDRLGDDIKATQSSNVPTARVDSKTASEAETPVNRAPTSDVASIKPTKSQPQVLSSNVQSTATSQQTSAKPQTDKSASPTGKVKNTRPLVTQSQHLSPTASLRQTSTNQAPTFGEDGKLLVPSTDIAPAKQPRVYIVD